MLKCGDYTLDRQIGWGRAATYFTAFAGDEAGEHRLVVRYSRYTDRAHIRAFLQAAAEQQNATACGCRRVAPVLDFGVAESGHAYGVHLNYETSLAECIQAGNAIDHDRLRFIVTGILGALAELRDKFKRPHGNLSAGNILFDQKGEIILTDMAPVARDLRYYPDLQALGEIIYQLVRQSLRVGFLSPPLERSPEWAKSLGDHADDWREFTNRMLLTKRGEGQEGLKRAIADLKALNTLAEQAAPEPVAPNSTSYAQPSGQGAQFSGAAKKRKSRVGLVLTILAVLGIGSGAFFYFRPKEEVKVVDSTIPPPPTPREILEKLPESTAYSGADNYLRRTKNSSKTYSDIRQYLYDWPVPGKLADLAKVWNAPGRDWQELAETLQTEAYDDVVETQSQAPDPEILMKAAADIGRMSQTLADAEALEKAWARVEKLTTVTAERKIAGLPDFKAWVVWRIKSAGDVKTAVQNATTSEAALSTFNNVARVNELRIHPDAWKKATAELKDFQDPKVAEQWPQLWEKAIGASLKPDDLVMQGWIATLDATKKQILKRPPGERPALQAKVAELETRVKQALAGPDEAPLTKAINDFQKTIRHPLEDMDAQYRALVAKLDQSLIGAADTATAVAALKTFTDGARALRTDPEFRAYDAAFIAQHNVDKVINDLNAAIAKPIEPQFGFTNSTWVRAAIADNKATYTWNGRPMTFHILKNLNVAIASMEMPLSMAKTSGVPLDSPGANGPLAYRDTRNGAQRWLWPRAEQWYNSAIRRKSEPDAEELADPSTLFAAPDPSECPVTWISAGTAKSIAQAFGARLPSRAEWQAALSAFRPSSGRLRGPTATRVDQAIQKYRVARSPITPFAPVPPTMNYGGTPPFAVTPADENTIWLRSVRDTPAGISDLIGNASEWVADDGGNFVVGGSFATLPTVNFTDPKRSDTGEGNCDITLRLAVPVAPGEKDAPVVAARKVSGDESLRLRTKAPIEM